MKNKGSYAHNIFKIPEPFSVFNVLTREPYHHLAPHSHDKYHVNTITYGSADIITGCEKITVNAGDAFIMPPNLEHEIISKTGYSQVGMDISDINDEYGLVANLYEICNNKAVKVKVKNTIASNYVTSHTLVDMSPLSRLKCINYMTDLLINIIESAWDKPTQDNFKTRFIQVAKECSQKGTSLEELCHIMNFSKTHLERLTKREFGCSAIEYMDKLRFLRICSLLETTDKKLSAIAEECGFFDSSHLCVFFKKHSGKTPTQYRKESH